MEVYRIYLKQKYRNYLTSEGNAILDKCLGQIVTDLLLDQNNTRKDQDWDSKIIAGYQTNKQRADQVVCVDFGEVLDPSSPWRKENHQFFTHLKTNQFDSIIVEDATRQLQDDKGFEKENQFTLCKVIGLEYEDRIIPAERMMLKIRGLSYYRAGTTHLLDTLKEYASYRYIHEKSSETGEYVLEVGPIIFNLEKLAVPFDREETRKWIGFFLEEIKSSTSSSLYTTRLVQGTDFWSLGACLKKVKKGTTAHQVKLDQEQIKFLLSEFGTWSWLNGFSIDYCDAALFLTPDGDIKSMKIFDFERINFGELVNENHIVLDTLIDIKTYLRKSSWDEILHKVYLSDNTRQEPLPLDDVKIRLNKKNGIRHKVITVMRYFRFLSFRFGQRTGKRLWNYYLQLFARLSSIIH